MRWTTRLRAGSMRSTSWSTALVTQAEPKQNVAS
jgi:hypothetical protein